LPRANFSLSARSESLATRAWDQLRGSTCHASSRIPDLRQHFTLRGKAMI
jgi:hypothetical protein